MTRPLQLNPISLCGLIFALWVGRVFLLPIDEAIESTTLKFMWTQALRYGIWVLPVVLYLRHVERAPVLRELGLATVPRGRALAEAGLLIAAYMVFTIAYSLATGLASFHHLTSHTMSEWTVLLLLTPLAPVAEEILFRGFLLPQLTRRCRFSLANLIQSALFVAIHWPGWLYMRGMSTALLHDSIGVFLIALVLGYLFYRTQSLWPPILLHTLNNLWMGASVD